MEEFNLKRALAGEPLITRSGESVTEFKKIENIGWPYLAKIKGHPVTFTRNGKCGTDSMDHPYDLFMAEPELKEGDLVLVSNDGERYFKQPRIFITKDKNLNAICLSLGDEALYEKGEERYSVSSWKHFKSVPKQPQIEITVKINGKEAKLSDISDETLQNIKKIENQSRNK